MLFLSPLALLGLVAVVVPPLLHLFQRRQPPAFEFPAVRYLRQTEREAQRTLRLRHLLLLVLRVIAVALLVLAAARPVVPRGVGALHEPTAVALVLDNSLSAGAVVAGSRVLDDLAARARETLRAAQPGDALWVIGADGVARRGASGELLELVTRMQPEARRLDVAEAVRVAARLVEGSGYARGEVHLLSDLQATALGDGNRESAIGNGDSAARGMPVLVYHPPGEPPANRGVVAARPRPTLWLAGTGSVLARVAGAPQPAGRVAVALTLEGRPGGRALADSGAVVLAAPATAPGWRAGDVSLEADELRADDRRPFAVRAVPPAVVTVDASADPGPFVREALAVLAQAGQIRFGAGGVRFGTTIVFPPTDVTQLGAVNRTLAAAGVAWRFGPRRDREDSLVSADVPELAGARVRVRYRLEAPAPQEGAVLARADGDPWLVRSGGVVLVGSRMVPEETTLPLSGGFVPFVAALANRVARGEAGVLAAAPGDAVALPSRATALQLAADSSQRVDGGAVIAAPGATGVYAVLAGADTAALLVVAADPRESDLRRADAAAVRARLPLAAVTVTDDAGRYAARRFRGAGRSELTGWLLAAALLVLLAEAAVASGGLGRNG